MIGGNAHSRRAEEFDAALSGRAGGASREQYAELLDVVASLRAVPEPVARPEFVADLRRELVAAAAELPARRTDDATALRLTPKQRRGSRERRIAAVLGGFAVVAASGSMAVASQSALPGDALYPVKRAIENAHANLQSSPDAKAAVLLHNADTRLSEVEELTQRQDAADPSEISSTLQDFKEQANQASALALDDYTGSGDDEGLTAVRDFADDSMDRLTALGDVLPSEARPALIAAAQTVQTVDLAAYDACPTCTDTSIAQLPEFALTSGLGDVVQGTVKAALPQAQASRASTPKSPSGPKSSSTPHADPSSPLPSVGNGDGDLPLPPVPALPTGPTDEPTKKKGVVTGTVDGITKHLLGGGSGDSTSGSGDGSGSDGGGGGGDDSVVGTLTDLLGLN